VDEEAIFAAALEKPSPAERRAYLADACTGDADLRARVEALLQAHDDPDSFLEPRGPGPALTVDELPLHDGPGTVIGPYKLMEQIGEGGMGLVFIAEQQQPVRRKVALKVIKPGMDSRQVVARFEAERQALALMDHPNIAQVHDGGSTPTGRPYFVMELVKGVPITDYCDLNQVPIRQRLQLFLHVCQAVQHAHQKGIIHRDIKPSNVLIMSQDGTPVVKVIDFGVAKAIGQQLTDKTIYTQFTQLIGTPLYMSPEQAGQSSVDVDTRSDIYSLGVLLYELLTGTTPFDKERLQEVGFDELRRIIREEEPARPSTRISTLGQAATTVCTCRRSDPKRLSRLLRGEPDWIVMKALEKDRNRRYETASAFAADVERYLAEEPVLACPPSSWYRFRKFARRNKARLAVVALILSFLVILGTAATWYQQDQAARGVVRAERQRETERGVTSALVQAETLLAEGDRQIDQPKQWQATVRLAQAAQEKAEELLTAGVGTEQLAAHVRQVRAAVDAAVADSGLQVEVDRIRLEQGLARKYGKGPEGIYQFGRGGVGPHGYAAALRRYGVDPSAPEAAAARVRGSRVRTTLLIALDDWLRRTPLTEAVERQQLNAILEAAEPELGAWEARWRTAARRRDRGALLSLAEAPEVQALPAVALAQLAWHLRDVQEPKAAERVLRAGQQRYPSDFWLNWDLAMVLSVQTPQRPGEEARYLTAAVVLRGDSPPVHYMLGSALFAAGDLGGAMHSYQAALRLDADYLAARSGLGSVHVNLGVDLFDKGRLDEAIAETQKAIRMSPWNNDAHYNLGEFLLDKGQVDDAIAEYKLVIRAANGIFGPKFYQKPIPPRLAQKLMPVLAQAHRGLANALRRKGRVDEAIAEGSEAIRLKPDLPKAHGALAAALSDKGRFEEAVAEYREALRLKPAYAWARSGLAIALNNWGWFCQQPHRQLYAASARHYADAFAADPKVGDYPNTARCYNAACAAALAGCGKGKDAAALDDRERARLRRRALAWLQADLAACRVLLEKEPDKARPHVRQHMQHCQQDGDFAGVRGREALARLPEAERPDWDKLWQSVQELASRAAATPMPGPPKGP
jgi:serine/threonine protein kinase/tetratricopeptide (TPR) repeat protein